MLAIGRRKSRGGIFKSYGPCDALTGKRSFEPSSRLFVDPPALPALQGGLASHAHGFFIAERVLGAFFSILFFLAISGTVVR